MERSKELEMLGEFTSGTPLHGQGSRARALPGGGLSGSFEQRMARIETVLTRLESHLDNGGMATARR
jgi:hypothetical protein